MLEECAEHIDFKSLPLEFTEQLPRLKELNILVVGCFQVGKSALINAMFFKKGYEADYEKAKEGSLKPCTDKVEPYTIVIGDNENSVKVNIYDSPGLQDGVNDDKKYLDMMISECENIHLVIYCTKIGEAVRKCEEIALKHIISLFHGKVPMVIALTFANQLIPAIPNESKVNYFKRMVRNKKAVLHDTFMKITTDDVCDDLIRHTYPVGSAADLKLPTGENWQVQFWLACLRACQPESSSAFMKVACKHEQFKDCITVIAQSMKFEAQNEGDKIKLSIAVDEKVKAYLENPKCEVEVFFDTQRATGTSSGGKARHTVSEKFKDVAASVKDKVSSTGEMMKDRVSFAGEMVKEKVSSAGEMVKDKVSSAGEMVKEKVSSAGEMVKEKVSSAGEMVKEKVSSAGEMVKDKVCSATVKIKDKVYSVGGMMKEKISSLGEKKAIAASPVKTGNRAPAGPRFVGIPLVVVVTASFLELEVHDVAAALLN